MPELQTARLLLRPLAIEDAAQVQELFPQWEVVRHLAARFAWPFPPEGVLTYYRDQALPAMARGDEWHWTLRLKPEPNTIIGAIGLMREPAPPDPNHSHRGFWPAPQHHNQGLMTEAVITINDYWFDVLLFPVLRTGKAAANVTSRRISEKTGMRLIATGENDYISGHQPSETWEITREQWHAWRTNKKSSS